MTKHRGDEWFKQVCRIVRGLRYCRIGAVGARPAAFNTVRYSETVLEQHGISVETLDLSELLGWARGIEPGDAGLKAKLDEITGYLPQKDVPAEAMEKMARLALVIDQWMADRHMGQGSQVVYITHPLRSMTPSSRAAWRMALTSA